MREEEVLDLGRGDLETFVLEEFLEAAGLVLPYRSLLGQWERYLLSVYDIEFAVPQDPNVACAEPVFVEGFSRGLRVVEIALCDERASD